MSGFFVLQLSKRKFQKTKVHKQDKPFIGIGQWFQFLFSQPNLDRCVHCSGAAHLSKFQEAKLPMTHKMWPKYLILSVILFLITLTMHISLSSFPDEAEPGLSSQW